MNDFHGVSRRVVVAAEQERLHAGELTLQEYFRVDVLSYSFDTRCADTGRTYKHRDARVTRT